MHRHVYVLSSLLKYGVDLVGEIVDGPTPKYQQLADILRERLKTMRPGEPVPSETRLEAEFGLARGTIRKAVGVLRDEGLVVTTRGKGSYVAER